MYKELKELDTLFYLTLGRQSIADGKIKLAFQYYTCAIVRCPNPILRRRIHREWNDLREGAPLEDLVVYKDF